MKHAPTLADAAIRASLGNKLARAAIPPRLGQLIAQARKFVLDEGASRFLCDLSHATFRVPQAQAVATLEQCRQLSRLPHALTWIEYDSRAFRMHTEEHYREFGHMSLAEDKFTGKRVLVRDDAHKDLSAVTRHIGWLLEQFSDDLFTCTLVAGQLEGDDPRDRLPMLLPQVYCWTTTDRVPPFDHIMPTTGVTDAYLATGMRDYEAPQIRIGMAPERNEFPADIKLRSLTEWIGEMRFVWSLLAAINDIPVGVREVKPSKGYYAKGKYRNFVTHSVISILIPKNRTAQTLAKEVVAISRRRAHQVRGHWRRDWRHEGHKIWVREHQRGDAALGFVTHDYEVKHEQNGAN